MRGTLKTQWHAFKASKPGQRFRDRYDLRHLITRNRFNWSQVLHVTVGSVAVMIGILMLVTPGPGSLIIILGLALLASEILFLARILDWSELKTLRPLRRLKSHWKQMTLPTRMLAVGALLLTAAGVSYVGYLLVVNW